MEGPGDSHHVQLEKTMGLRNGVGIILGTIIGSGIFVSPKGVLQHSGSVGASLILWVLCGVLTMLGSLSYTEIASVIPVSGGPYAYTLRAFGDLPGFLIMWMTVMIRGPISNAITSIACANYMMEPFFPLCDQPETAVKLLAISMIIGIAAINCCSVKWATRVQDFLSLIKLVSLAVIIIAGIAKIVKDQIAGIPSRFDRAFDGTISHPGEWALGLYAGMFSYAGWYNFNYVAEEIKNPNRNLTLAIFISVPVVVFVYVMANVAYFAVLDVEVILESNAVAVTFGDKMFGVMSWIVPVLVALSIFGSVNGGFIVAPRLIFVAARQGHLPHFLALISLKYITPITAVLFSGLISTTIVVFSIDLDRLMSYFAFMDILTITAPIIGLIYLKRKHPDLPRPIKVHNAVHVIYLCVSLVLLILPFFIDPLKTFYGILMFLSGLPFYWIGVVWKNKPAFMKKCISNSSVIIQKLFFAAKTDAFIIETG